MMANEHDRQENWLSHQVMGFHGVFRCAVETLDSQVREPLIHLQEQVQHASGCAVQGRRWSWPKAKSCWYMKTSLRDIETRVFEPDTLRGL